MKKICSLMITLAVVLTMTMTAMGYDYVSFGSVNETVTQVQQRLIAPGYDCGPVDGYFGTYTESAVLAFQQDYALYVDGVAGPQTLGVLFPAEDDQPMIAEDEQPMIAEDEQPMIAEGIWDVEIREIRAGTVLSAEAVEALGVDSFFSTEEISDETFARMKGRSFGDDCTMSREELRYIRCLHKDWHGQILVGELVMNQMVADQVCDIFRKLYEAAYPIERMVLIDEYDGDDEASIMENNTSAFNYRTIDDTDIISRHAYGLAIDINPYYNVYYIPLQNYIFPEDGWAYLDREAEFPYKLVSGDLCYELFREAGFEWGGWWIYNIDYQHFQFSPDAH